MLPPLADPETNIYSFGILLIEIISGKSPYAEEKESLLNWVNTLSPYFHVLNLNVLIRGRNFFVWLEPEARWI